MDREQVIINIIHDLIEIQQKMDDRIKKLEKLICTNRFSEKEVNDEA